MRCLLTGGTGFFGKAILRRFCDTSSEPSNFSSISVITRDPEKFLNSYPLFRNFKELNFIKGDILDKKSLNLDSDYDVVIHAAADSADGHSLSKIDRFNQIVHGTQNILELAHSVRARRFLFTSSGAVYGKIDRAGFREESCCAPDSLNVENVYGISKRLAEHLCILYAEAYEFDVIIARCFSFVGPDLPVDAHFAIGNFIRDALWSNEIVVSGDGRSVRSYLYQDDLAKWLEILLMNGQRNTAYNVGSDQKLSISELAYLVRDLLAPEKNVNILNGSSDNGARTCYFPDISRICEDLGVRVEVELEDAIRKTAAYLLNKGGRI